MLIPKNLTHILYYPDDNERVVGEDGTIPVEDEETSEMESDEETASGEQEQETEEKPDEGKPKNKEDKYADNPTYVGKSREEIIEMHLNAQAELQRTKEKGSAKSEDRSNWTIDDYVEKMSSTDLREALSRANRDRAKIDPELDPDAYEAASAIVADVEAALVDKRTQERLQSTEIKSRNDAFMKDYLQKQQDHGIEIKDPDSLKNAAMNYAEDGILTERSMAKAMIDVFEPAQIQKFYEMTGNQKAREEIKAAAGKQDQTVTVGQGKSKGKRIKIDEASPHQVRSAVRSMPDDELFED